MIFDADGRRYDTFDMDCFATNAPHEPFIFITRDLRSVFIQTMDRHIGVGVRQAKPSEIRRLWQTYGLAPLLRMLAATDGDPAPAQHRDARAPDAAVGSDA